MASAHMRRVTQKRSLARCQSRGGGNLDASGFNLLRPLAALAQAKGDHAPARRYQPRKRPKEVALSPTNPERLGNDEKPAV